MSMPQQRLRDPQPLARGGEVAFVIVAGALLLLGLAALTGLGAAAAVFGAGWVWPDGVDQIGQVLRGVLSGHPGWGLPESLQEGVPGRAAVYSCIAVSELVMLSVVGTTGVLFWRSHRPGDARRGMATRAEAQQVLGRSRLRRARHLLRPDLFRPTGSRIGSARHPSRGAR